MCTSAAGRGPPSSSSPPFSSVPGGPSPLARGCSRPGRSSSEPGNPAACAAKKAWSRRALCRLT
eukprot:8963539-Pyramimonas_sp.AAC.1